MIDRLFPSRHVQQKHLSVLWLFYLKCLQAMWSLTVKIDCSGAEDSKVPLALAFSLHKVTTSQHPQMDTLVHGCINAPSSVRSFSLQPETFGLFILSPQVCRQMRNNLPQAAASPLELPFWPRLLQPDWTCIPPGCAPPRFDLLPRLSKAACIHFNALEGYKGKK